MACHGPIGRVSTRGGAYKFCLACKSQRLAERRRASITKFRTENPARWRTIQRRARLKAQAAFPPAPESMCKDCGQPTKRGPYAERCHPCKRAHGKLRSRYGIGSGDFARMLAEQKGLCAICHELPDGHGELHVDHDHATGRVRGLLCASCNLGLGNLKDDVSNVREALLYLTR